MCAGYAPFLRGLRAPTEAGGRLCRGNSAGKLDAMR